MRFHPHCRMACLAFLFLALSVSSRAQALDELAFPPIYQGEIRAFKTDPFSGFRYVTGVFLVTEDFDLRNGQVVERTPAGSTDVFVTAYDALGNHRWTQTLGGTGIEIPFDILLANNRVYVCGFYASSDAVLGGTGTPLPQTGGNEAFVLSLNAGSGSRDTGFGTDGVVTLNGAGNETFSRMAYNGSRLLVGGFFMSATATLEGGTQLVNTDPMGLTFDGFVLALNDASGAPDISFSGNGVLLFAGAANEIVHALDVTVNDEVFAGGHFESSNFGIETVGSVTSIGAFDVFVAAVSAAGVPDAGFSGDGIQTFGGTLSDKAFDLKLTGGGVAVTGDFNSTDAGFSGTAGAITTTGNFDAYVLQLDATGAPITGFGGDGVVTIGGPEDDDTSFRVVVAGSGIYAAGVYRSTSGGIDGSGSAASFGVEDAFVAGINAINGNALTQFSADGIQLLSSTDFDRADGLDVANGRVFMAGSSFGIARIGLAEPSLDFSNGVANGFIVELDENNGLPDDVYEQNDAPSVAFPVFPINGTVAGLYGNDDDFYLLNLLPGQFSASMVHDAAATTLFELRDASGTTVLATGTAVNTSTRQIDFTIAAAGDYFLHVTVTAPLDRNYSIASTGAGGGGGGGNVPVITDITLSQNPGRVGVPITFTVTATDPTGPTPPSIDWEFGDGDVAVGNPTTHTYLAPGTYMAFVGATNANGTTVQSFSVIIEGPNSGGSGQTIATDDPVIANPLDGLSVSVASSDGGVVELSINVDAIVREVFDVDTAFTDLPGRGTPSVKGTRPVKKFTGSGIFISTTKATDNTDGVIKGRVRKTLPISRRETGETALVSAAPPSAAISKFSLKGKFVFDKADSMDEVTFSGSINVPVGLDLTQPQPFSVSVGNVVEDVTLDPKGKPTSTGAAGRIKKLKVTYPKAKKGTTTTIAGQIAKFSFTLRLKDADIAGFDTEGITNKVGTSEASLKSVPRKIQTALVLAGVSYDGLIDVQYKLAKDKGDGVLSGRGGK